MRIDGNVVTDNDVVVMEPIGYLPMHRTGQLDLPAVKSKTRQIDEVGRGSDYSDAPADRSIVRAGEIVRSRVTTSGANGGPHQRQLLPRDSEAPSARACRDSDEVTGAGVVDACLDTGSIRRGSPRRTGPGT